jgi:hypothetical protein
MLDEHQLNTLKAVVNTIIPPDDFPAGWEAGVGDYLLQQFTRDLQPIVSDYQQWLGALNDEACAVHGKVFAEISSEAQTELLAEIEQGQIQVQWNIDAAAFFQLIVAHCAEGFYANPENGGNKDGIGWQMIGFEVRG